MAKLPVTIAVFLFFLAIGQARISLDQKESAVIKEDDSTNEQESNPKTTATWSSSILLPSQKLESESETEAKSDTSEPGKLRSKTNDFFPLTVINFHPINRHFRDPSLTFRHRRPCHHHRLAKPWGTSLFHHRDMTYGNDMLVPKGNDRKEEPREIPANWRQFPHGGDAHMHRFHFWRDEAVAMREGIVRPHHHHFHRSHVAEVKKERAGYEQEQKQQTGFMTQIRKFLNHL